MRRRPGGFTLIELLVALAILAILAAIITPVFIEIGKRAREKEQLNKTLLTFPGVKPEQGGTSVTLPSNAYMRGDTLVITVQLR